MSEVIARMDQIVNTGMNFMHSLTIMIVVVVLGVIVGLFGLKLSRVWAAFIGFLVGAGIGAAISYFASLEGLASVGVMIAGAVIVAVLFCIFFKVGVFFFMIFLVAGCFVLATGKQTLLFIGIGGGIGLIAAILTVVAFDPIVIIITSLIGGGAAGYEIVNLLKMNDRLPFLIGIPAGLALIFAIIQFIMKSRQVGKKQAEKADEMKLKVSRENEVEEARMLLDGDLDDIEDGDLDDDDYYDDDDDDDYYFDDDDENASLEDDEDFTILDE